MGIMFYVWLMIMISAIVVEIATTDLTSFWFSIGSFFALILNLFVRDSYIWLQILVFTIVSILAIIFLRPLVKKKLETPKFSTNIDALVGKNALVTTDINEFCLGTVKIEGIEWSAFSECKETIASGEIVTICEVVGNKLKVKNK